MPQQTAHLVPFSDLTGSNLIVDAVYEGGKAGNSGDDAIGKVLPVGNQGGFRFNGSAQKRSVKLVALYTTGADPDWPDELDVQTGLFTYYGDNKRPGKGLHESARGGNLLLQYAFELAHGSEEERGAVPPFFLFERGARGRDAIFRGLLAPGAESLPADDELTASWRSSGTSRFQNYRARFTVLNEPEISRAWIDELLSGTTLGPSAPESWKSWVKGRTYNRLVAPATVQTRSRQEQTPDKNGRALISAITQHFRDDPYGFEACAVELWKMQAPNTGDCELTRRSRDGGRDATGVYMLGPHADPVPVQFALEAKCYGEGTAVGVRDTARLISRLRHRQFGVFVTTSHFQAQAYHEIRDDHHPVVMMCGKDIAELLRNRGYSTPTLVKRWLHTTFPPPSRH